MGNKTRLRCFTILQDLLFSNMHKEPNKLKNIWCFDNSINTVSECTNVNLESI
jgi:hypothetical protein